MLVVRASRLLLPTCEAGVLPAFHRRLWVALDETKGNGPGSEDVMSLHTMQRTLLSRRPSLPLRFLLRLFIAVALGALALTSLACKKSEPTAASQKAVPAGAAEAPRGTSGATFDPALLENRFVSREFLVTLPPTEGQTLRVTLLGKPQYTLALRVAVECADQASFDELTKRGETLLRALTESAQACDSEFARTAEGRLAIKEDIAARIQQSMEHKRIKQVHFIEYRIENVR